MSKTGWNRVDELKNRFAPTKMTDRAPAKWSTSVKVSQSRPNSIAVASSAAGRRFAYALW
jgi:hypothetical protein